MALQKEHLNAILIYDDAGNPIIEGNMQYLIKDASQYKISCGKINLPNFLNLNINRIELYTDISNSTTRETNNIEYESESMLNQKTSFYWNDASTKLFLDIYKAKKDLVSTRKIKTYKLLWRNIAEDMLSHGYHVSPLQIENKFKTMERSYKNMISNNNKTGRARKTCSYETELTELLGKKHNVQPLALSGRNGLLLRENAAAFNTENNALLNKNDIHEEFEDDVASDSTISSNSTVASNSTAVLENVKINKPKIKPRNAKMADYLKQCKDAMDMYASEMKGERERSERVQLQILDEYKNIRSIHENFAKSAKEQWTITNTQREEKNKILKEIKTRLETSNSY